MTRRDGALLVLGVVAWSSPARAGAVSPDAVTRVELRVVGPEAERAPLEASLREVVGRVGLTLLEDGERPAGGSLALVTIDLGAPGAVHVSIADGRDGKLLVERDVPRTAGPSVAREDTAIVVRSALDALIEAGRITPASTSAPAPASAPAAAPILDLAASGALAWIASGLGPAAGAGLSAAFRPWPGPLRPSFSVGATPHFSQQATVDGVSGSLASTALRALASLELAGRGGWEGGAGVGGGADVLALSVSSDDPGAQATPPGTQAGPVATAALSARAPLWGALALVGAVEVDADLAPVRFVVERSGGHDPLFTLTPWRVGVSLGLALRVLGGEGAP